MHFTKTFPICLSILVYTTAASPVDISADLSIRELSANITARDAAPNDLQTRGGGVPAPQSLQDAAGSIPLGARSLFHKHKPVRCMGNTGFFCEKNCACTKGGGVSCEKLSKAEVKKWKNLHKDDGKVTMEEHASQITDNCAGVCSCDGGKVPGTTVRKIGVKLKFADLEAAAYHVTEKDTRGHVPVPAAPPGDPHAMPPGAPPASPGFPPQSPAIDSYNPEVDSYSPPLQRRGSSSSALKDPQHAGQSLNSKERIPPSCKGSRPVCQGHCYCKPTGELACDNLTKAQKKSFGSGPAVPDLIHEHARNVKTACEPWCECKGKGKDWVEGKSLTDFNYGAGRNRETQNPKSISSADPVDLTGTEGSEMGPENTRGSLSVDRGHSRPPEGLSSPSSPRDDRTPDLSSTASPSLSLKRRGNTLSSSKADGYSALHSGPDHTPHFHREPVKCASTWGPSCESNCHCTRQGKVACDRLPEHQMKLLEARPDLQQNKADQLAYVLGKCNRVCGCKDREGVYRIEGRTFEEWKQFVRASPFPTPHIRSSASAAAAGVSSPSTPSGRDTSPRHGAATGDSPAVSSPLSPSHPPVGKPPLHRRGVILATDKETSTSLETSSQGSRSNTPECSNRNGQKAFCEAQCHCTGAGKVLCGKQKDGGNVNTVTQSGTEGCLSECQCIPEGEKARERWGAWKLPGGGRGLTRGPGTPEYPTDRPDYSVRGPQPQTVMPLWQPPPRLPSSLTRQFPTFNQHTSQVLRPRGGSNSKVKEKTSAGPRLVCHSTTKSLCETSYTCDATGMILNRPKVFKAKCIGLACTITPKLTGTPQIIAQCKSTCLCLMRGQGEIRQIGGTGELWGGFTNPGQRGVSRRIRKITEHNEESPAAEAPSSSQAGGQTRSLHARAGVGNTIKNKLSPPNRKLVCEGEPKGPCESIYSCDKNGAMKRKCSFTTRCISLPEDEHTAAQCKAACLCTDFKNDKLLRQIGTTGEEWGGFRAGVDALTSKWMNNGKKLNNKKSDGRVLELGDFRQRGNRGNRGNRKPVETFPTPSTIQRRGGAFSANKGDQHTPDETIACSGPGAKTCKKKCACTADGTVICGNKFGPATTPWVRGAMLTTGENAQKEMTEQEATFTAECATACQCRVDGVFAFGGRKKLEDWKVAKAGAKGLGIGRFRVGKSPPRSPAKSPGSPDGASNALSVVDSQPPPLQRRGGSDRSGSPRSGNEGGSPRGRSDSLDTATSSAAIPGTHPLKTPILCEGKDKGFCEERCYCTPEGMVKCDSRATFEDLFVQASPPPYQLNPKRFKDVRAQYLSHVIGRCVQPTCKCDGLYGFRDPVKGLQKALSVSPSRPPSLQPRSGTDLVYTVPSSTPATGIKPRSGTDLAKF